VRALAAFDAEAWPKSSAAQGPEELNKIGWGKGDGTILRWLDPISEDSARPRGEDRRGIACRRNPWAWLLDSPELQPFAVSALDGGLVLEGSSPGEIDDFSHAEFELACLWRSAVARRMRREIADHARPKT
jgi:hypothetical protein